MLFVTPMFSASPSHGQHNALFTAFFWPSQLYYPKFPLMRVPAAINLSLQPRYFHPCLQGSFWSVIKYTNVSRTISLLVIRQTDFSFSEIEFTSFTLQPPDAATSVRAFCWSHYVFKSRLWCTAEHNLACQFMPIFLTPANSSIKFFIPWS
jgi:hypothetical protein